MRGARRPGNNPVLGTSEAGPPAGGTLRCARRCDDGFSAPAGGIACSDLGEEIVILDLRASTYFSVRRTGAHLVTALMDGASTDALVAGLCARYDVTEDMARADVQLFLLHP